MKNLDYAYCVARLRANETYMLDKSFMMNLCECENFEKGVSVLVEHGWLNEKGGIKEITDKKNRELWKLLNDCVPDKKELEVFCILNDFFNIKTAVKCFFTGSDPFDYFIYPTSVDLSSLVQKIRAHDFSSLKFKEAAITEKAYKTACITENGQSAEIIIDRGAIDCLSLYAKDKTGSLVKDVCGFLCDTANIKIALRINALKKNRDFAEEAIGNCFGLDRRTLVNLSLGDSEILYNYLHTTVYSEGVSLYSQSSTLFEKWCDDSVIDIVSKAKYTSFGFDPVCAFYYAKQNEIKSISIILTAIKSGLSADKIKERVRLLYA